VNRRIGIFADDTIVETALTVAVASGNRAIVKLLLDHRADLNALNHYYRPNAEEAVALLFEMGEGAHARDLGQAATGVDLPQPDADLLEQARKLGSLFVAFADLFEAQGDRVSATRLYEWKVTAWENRSVWVDDEGDDEWDPPVRVPIHISLCLRTLGECKEAEGELQEALRLYRKALGTWGRHGELVDAAVLDGGYNPFTDLWLQFTLGLVPEGRRNEFAALLSDCERILGRLGMAEEQRRVTVALQRLESISRPGQ
jgi:tetratricopeptide (TPR) repeat protein